MNIKSSAQYSAVGGSVAPAAAQQQQQGRPPWVARMAMRAARARWFLFLRRAFHYQNGGGWRSSLGSNPFNSRRWMAMELAALTLQISVTLVTLCFSREENPLWPIRIWVVAYDFGCFISLLLLYWRYRFYRFSNPDDVELQLTDTQDDRGGMQVVSRCKASLELFYAMWFVMGNVWLFDSRLRHSSRRTPKLHALSVFLLATNAAAYSFPFLLFLLLCVFVPLLSSSLGFSLSLSSSHRSASDHQLSLLPSWTFTQHLHAHDSPECCICLAKYKDKEEIRQLPCSHIFHLKCVDHWLRIISCCPLCKQCLDP